MWRITRYAAALGLLAGLGCVKRLEIVAVFPDGSGRLVSSIEGDEADVREGDAMPSSESGWQVRERLEIKPADSPDEADKRELMLVGSTTVRAGDAWPDSYAPAGSRLWRIATRFPTDVWIEERADGTYYHFRRVYQGRPVARIDHLREKILEQDSIKELQEKDPASLSDQERKTLVRAFIEFEREQARVFVDRAFAAVDANLRQDVWLAAREAAGRAYGRPGLLEEAIEISKAGDSGGQLASIERRLKAEVESDVRAAMTDRGVVAAVVDRVIDAMRLATDAFEISEDIQDEEWMVSVALPGRIIGHNSTEQVDRVELDDDEAEDTSIEAVALGELAAELRKHMADGVTFESINWDVSGQSFHDADVVLAATSFVPRTSTNE